MEFATWYDKNYKKLLVIPAILLILSLLYIGIFYVQNDSAFYRDVSLTGGTTYTISTDYAASSLESDLSRDFNDFTVGTVSDSSGRQVQVIVTVTESDSERMNDALVDILGFELTGENSSIQFTNSSLSGDFFKQLVVAVILAFFWMAAVVFVIFSKGWKIKSWIIVGNILFAIFLGNYLFTLHWVLSAVIFLAFAYYFVNTYIKNSVPAFAVMFSAFADIVMTLAVVDLLGMRLSTAGIVAFLMIIGYSVDTDILLTTRVLNKKGGTNEELIGAFKTGITMGLTSFIAIATALIVVYSFGSVLNQIFIILLIGLAFDILNTWITNASILKWYADVNL
ncbi:MAG: preprotein translocase subunit SecF [Patescibacteria group bacterium]|jgi:preprotein translocase subunit SecF